MPLKKRADLLDLQSVHILHRHDAMWIAHRYTGHTVVLSIHRHRLIHNRPIPGSLDGIGVDRNLLRHENWRTHIDLHQLHLLIFYRQMQRLDPAVCLDGNIRPVRQAIIIHILRHTANPVSTHFCAGAIRIINLHLKICHR